MVVGPHVGKVASYSFELDDETWEDWKDTVPRSQRLDERIIELLIADTRGRVDTEGIDVDISDHINTSDTEGNGDDG